MNVIIERLQVRIKDLQKIIHSTNISKEKFDEHSKILQELIQLATSLEKSKIPKVNTHYLFEKSFFKEFSYKVNLYLFNF